MEGITIFHVLYIFKFPVIKNPLLLNTMPKKSGKAKARKIFRTVATRFQTIRDAEVKKFKSKHGKPTTFDDYAKINKAAGVVYRRKYGK
jgi:hypothetical protein